MNIKMEFLKTSNNPKNTIKQNKKNFKSIKILTHLVINSTKDM